jgi:hypothetical protein
LPSLKLITPPATEPVSLADAYDYARVTTPDDALMSSLITAAREYAETYTRRQFVTATWLYALDAFRASFIGPGYDTFRQPATLPQTLGSFPFGTMSYPWNVIDIPLPPLQAIDSIVYIDPNGQQQTLDPSQYIVDAVTQWGRITPSFGQIWPPTRPQLNAVQITFTAGYATLPQKIVQAIKLIVNHWWDHRHAVSDVPFSEVPLAARSLLDSLKFGSYV